MQANAVNAAAPKSRCSAGRVIWEGKLCLNSACKFLADVIPVENLEKGFDVVGAAVLVLQVVGVLPDIDAEDGTQTWKAESDPNLALMALASSPVGAAPPLPRVGHQNE